MARLNLSRIDLRILDVFVDVVEHEGLSAAAAATGASLSSVTRDVAALETRLGLRLCQRGRGGFALTPQGEEVYRAARELMEGVRGFETRLAATRETLPGSLEIGLIEHMFGNRDCALIPALSLLRQTLPDLSLRVSVHPVKAIEVLVRERKLDIGFTGAPDMLAPLSYFHAFDEVHALYVSRTCPDFEAIWSWRPESGAPLPYVKRTVPAEPFRPLEERLPFRVTAIGSSLEGILAAVVAGFGAGILPLHVARAYSNLVALPVAGETLRVPFYLTLRRDAERRPEIKAFLKLFAKDAPDGLRRAQV